MKMNVVVTGCSSGFGEQIALTLARAGSRVFATMRQVAGKNGAAAAQLARIAGSEQLRLDVVEMDIADDRSVQAAAEKILRMSNEQIDVVVNNAGVLSLGVNESFSAADVHRVFDVNVYGAVRVNNAFLPGMRQRHRGTLVHISSICGRVHYPFSGVYHASKYALEGLAESYRHDLRQLGVDVVIIEPGAYPTAIAANAIFGSQSDRVADYDAANQDLQAQFMAYMDSLFQSEAPPDPREVADAVRDVLGKPAGQRPLRGVVDGHDVGVAELNAKSAEIQERLFRTMELTKLF